MKKIYDLNNNVKLSYNKFVWWISNFNCLRHFDLAFLFQIFAAQQLTE